MKSRLINFENNEKALNTKVFRYISFSTFKEIVEGAFTRLTRISKWEEHDPFENVLFKFPMVRGKELIGLNQLPRHYFAQCWTLTKESDLMWQLYRERYAERGGAVKLESTVGDLLNSVSMLNFSHVGKVKYLTKDKLITHSKRVRNNFEDILMNDMGRGRAIANMLLVKRYPYHQEKEVRLVVRLEDEDKYEKYFDHKTVIEDFISRVVFDPICKEIEFRQKKMDVLNVNDKLKIIRSELYKLKHDDFQ